jgi:hypothetical protein
MVTRKILGSISHNEKERPCSKQIFTMDAIRVAKKIRKISIRKKAMFLTG